MTFSYTSLGRMETAIDEDSDLEFVYDAMGRLTDAKTRSGGVQPATTITYVNRRVVLRVAWASSFARVEEKRESAVFFSLLLTLTIGLSLSPDHRLEIFQLMASPTRRWQWGL